MKQNDWLAISGVGILLILILAGIFAPLITSYDPNQIDLTDKLSDPSFTHLLGTDYLGRDLFSRILYGSRATLLLGTVLTIIILVLGVVIGCIAAINNGKIAAVIDGFCTLFLTLPSEMLGLVIIAVIGPSLEGLILAIVLPRWPWYVRMIQNDVKKILSTNYVQYAKLSGNSMFVILRKHVFPNISSQIMVYTTLDMGALITSIAALSFLGIGIQAPTAEWGRMLNEAREVANVYPWQMIPAGVVIFLVTLILNYLGDSLEGKIMRLVIKKLKIAYRNKILLDIPELMVNFSSLALMGPSGSGKSTLIKAIVKDNDIDLNQTGKIQLYGKSPQLRLGKEIRVIPQSPQNALDPFRKIRYQILETFKITEISKNYSLADFAKLCGISEKTFDLYPMQLSGGQAQRIICGLALIGKPQIIIADEPTSALDIEGRESFIELMNYALKKILAYCLQRMIYG